MKRFLSLFKRVNRTYLEIFIIFILSLTPLLWFKDNQIILGHDSGFRLSGFDYFKSLFYSWNSQGFGVDWGINKGFLITQLPEVILTELTKSLSIAQRVTFIYWFFVMGLSMYLLVRSFYSDSKHWIFRLFSSVFYMYNFFILQGWFIGERAKFSLYAALPLIVLVIYKTLKGKISIIKGTILFSFILFIFNGGGSPPIYGSVFLVTIIVFTYITFLSFFKRGLRQLLYSGLAAVSFLVGFVSLNAFWIVPQAYLFLNIYGSELSSVGGITGALVWEGIVNRFSSFINLFRFQGIPDWYGGFHPYSAPYIENPILIVASFIPIAVIVFGLLNYFRFDKKNKKKEIIFLMVFMYLVGLIFTSGSHPPFGFIYIFLIKNLPGFAIFRTAFYKFAPASWMPAIFLTGYFLNYLVIKFVQKRGMKIAIGAVSIIFLLVFHYPYFTSNFFEWNSPFSTKVNVPEYVKKTTDFINTLPIDGTRILLLPPLDSQFNSDNYKWGYWSLYLLPRLFNNYSVFAYDTDISELIGAMYSSLEKADEERFMFFAGISGVNKVIWRDDVLYNNKITTSKDVKFLEKNLESFKGVRLVKNFGIWRVYDIGSPYKVSLVDAPKSLSYVTSDRSSISDIFSAVGILPESSLVYSSATVNKDVGRILKHANSSLLEAGCVYCKPGEFTQFVDDLSIPYVNFLPGSIFYPFVEKSEQKITDNFSGFPLQLIDAYLGLSNKRIAETLQLTRKSGNSDKEERTRLEKLIVRAIPRYRTLIDKALGQLSNLGEVDKNSYSIKIYGYLTMQVGELEFLENQYNLAAESFNFLSDYLKEKRSSLEKDIWVTTLETSKRYIFNLSEKGIFNIDIVGSPLSPSKIILDGKEIKNLKQVAIEKGFHKLELIYPEPKNLLIYNPGEEKIDISKNQSNNLEIKDFDYASSYSVSFEYRATENTHPSLIISQDNDKINPKENNRDRVKKDLKASKNWRVYDFTFSPNYAAKKAYINFIYQGFNKFRKEEYFKVKNISVYKTYSPKVFLKTLNNPTPLETPEINFTQISPIEYSVDVKNVRGEFILSLNQTYDNGWKIYLNNGNKKDDLLSRVLLEWGEVPLAEKFHFRLNKYFNAWLIDQKGGYKIRIIYIPQKFFYVGTAASLMSALILIGILVVLRRFKRNETN